MHLKREGKKWGWFKPFCTGLVIVIYRINIIISINFLAGEKNGFLTADKSLI